MFTRVVLAARHAASFCSYNQHNLSTSHPHTAPAMRSLQWCALALSAAATANAYLDTSPFSLYSTSEYATIQRCLCAS